MTYELEKILYASQRKEFNVYTVEKGFRVLQYTFSNEENARNWINDQVVVSRGIIYKRDIE